MDETTAAGVQSETGESDLERRLRQSDQRFHALGRATGSMVWTTVPSGLVGDMPDWTTITGRSQESRAWGWLDAVHPDDRARAAQTWAECVNRAEPYIIDYRLQTPDGSYRWHKARGVPTFENGEICEWVGVIEDIDDRVTFERERDRFFNLGVDMMAIAGFDGYFKRLSPKWTELLGWTHEELLSRPYLEFAHPDDRERSLEVRKKLIEGHELVDFENRYRAKDGSYRWISWRAQPFAEERLLYAAATDVTERKLAEETLHENEERHLAELERLVEERTAELRAANEALTAARDAALAGSRAKSQFLANMSHEVRTPMNGVIGMTSLLLEKELDPDTRQIVRTIASSGTTLLRVIDDILDLSQIEAGKMGIERFPTDLDEVASDVMALFQGHGKSREVALIVNPPVGPTPKVLADPVRVRQVLSNLVSNAVKFTEEGSVELAWNWQMHAESIAVEFLVRDTGVGIPPDRQTEIFESFTQADGSTRRRFGGTGLGLSICKRLVDLMDGRLSVESEPGKWTCFRVDLSFDAAGEDEASPACAPTHFEGEPTRALHVLLAEDNEINVQVVTRMLEDCGCTVEVAGNGLQAIRLAANVTYDLVLMDVQMPVCDGLEAARSIRAAEAEQGRGRLPIHALTANAMREDQQECLAAGMDGFLPKPIPLTTLRALVADVRRRR